MLSYVQAGIWTLYGFHNKKLPLASSKCICNNKRPYVGNGLFGSNCVFSLEEDRYYMVMSPNAFVINKHHVLEIALLEGMCIFLGRGPLLWR